MSQGNQNKPKVRSKRLNKVEKMAQRIARDLTAEQLEECKEAFKMFDKDRNGTIDHEELALVMRLLGNNPTQGDIDNLMGDLDSDKNGKVEFDEFLVLMSKHLKEPVDEEQSLREAFEIFDRDGNNHIDAKEIRYVMKHIGEKMSDTQIDELFSWADTDGDGLLDYGEFVKIMSRR